jgi:transposase
MNTKLHAVIDVDGSPIRLFMAGEVSDYTGAAALLGSLPSAEWLLPWQVKGVLKAMPIKTDRRDAEGVARLLHRGWFRPVHCKSVSALEVRAVLGARMAVQQSMIALELSLRGLLRNFGLKVGTISRGRFELPIRKLAVGNPMLEAATEPMIRARSSLRHELAGLERRIRHLAQDDAVCRRLMWMPGIGAT